MSLAQFLAQLGGGNMGNQAMRKMPGFAGGMFNMDGTIAAPVNGGLRATPEQEAMTAALEARFPNAPAVAVDEVIQTPANMMEQIRSAPELRDPFAGGAAAPARPSPAVSKFTGLRDTLGQLGDYLLEANDMKPIYAPRKAKFEQEQANEAVAAYLGNINPALADVARRSPQTGMELFKALREDQRFDRTADQTDRQLGQTDRSQTETERRNRREEALTERGQTLSAATQLQLADLRRQEADIQRRYEVAMAAGEHARAKELLAIKQGYDIEIKRLEGGGGFDTITETVETPATKTGGFLGMGGTTTPAKKTVTERKVPRQAPQGQTVTKAQVQELAQARGMSYAEAERFARNNGFTVK